MYNKYFTMKRSELKEAIKNEITSVLLEGMSDKEREQRIQHLMRTGAKEKPLRKLAAIGKKEDEENLKEIYQTNSKMSQIVSLFQDMMDDEYDGQDYRKVLNMVLKAIDDDYKAAEREGEKFSRIREEDEMSDDEMDKKASKGAKKEPIGKEAERLAQVQKFMRQMQDKGIVDKDKKILDTPKYKEEFAKFKASLKK